MSDTIKKTYLPSEMAAEILALTVAAPDNKSDLDKIVFGGKTDAEILQAASNPGTTDPRNYESIADAIRAVKALGNRSYTIADEGKVVENQSFVEQMQRTVDKNGEYDTSKVNELSVNIPFAGIILSSDDEGKVVSNAELVTQSASTYTENGTYDTTKSGSATINIPINGIEVGDNDEGKIVKNGSLTAQGSSTVYYNDVYDTTEYDQLTVSVPLSGVTITSNDEHKVVHNGSFVPQTASTVTLNGVYDTRYYGEVTVNVPADGLVLSQADEGTVVVGKTVVQQGIASIPKNGTYSTSMLGTLNVSIFSGFSENDFLSDSLGYMTFRGQPPSTITLDALCSTYGLEGFFDISIFSAMTGEGRKVAYIGPTSIYGVCFPTAEKLGRLSAASYSESNHVMSFNTCLERCDIPLLSAIPSSVFDAFGNTKSDGPNEIAFPFCKEILSNTFRSCENIQVADMVNCSVIGPMAFHRCFGLTSVNFPVCTTIGSSAFAGCSNLTSVSFPVCTTIGEYAFSSCFGLTSVNFPVCTTIGSSAFAGCSNLTSVSFPVCTTIGEYAFSSCFGLTSVNFPVCTTIGSSAFAGCSNLTSVSFPVCSIIEEGLFFGCRALSAVMVPECTIIRANAFRGCTELLDISFPNCTTIEDNAFSECTSLVQANFPNCVSIGSGTLFWSCSNLKTISFPKLESAGSNAKFGGISSLESANFEHLTILPSQFFAGDTMLTEVSLPVCTVIGESAFYSCQSLSCLSLPMARQFSCRVAFGTGSLASGSYYGHDIAWTPFNKCHRLMSLYLLGSSVVSFTDRNGDLYNSSGTILETELLFSETPFIDSSYTGAYGSVYVPASLYAQYISASIWSLISDRIVSVP